MKRKPPNAAAIAQRWAAAYRSLPKARTTRARIVADARSFALAAFDLPCGLQIGWRADCESVAEQLEGRFAPFAFLDHEWDQATLVVWRENARGQRQRRVRIDKERSIIEVVAAIARLADCQSLALGPLNDGDDLHFIIVDTDVAQRMKVRLGASLLRTLGAS